MLMLESITVFGILLLRLPAVCKASVGYFWHVTDFHYDPTYSESHWSCKQNHQPGAPTGIYGDSWCDSPWLLIESSVSAMRQIEEDVDFILWTGDTIPHADIAKLSDGFNLEIQTNITRLLKESFPSKPVYATFGNHDYHPQDQFPPNTTKLYQEILDLWRDWIGDVDQEQYFLKGGYYTAKTTFGLRIVGLNTILYYTANKAVDEQGDISDQFQWLDDTLTAARRDGEKCWLNGKLGESGSSRTVSFEESGFKWRLVKARCSATITHLKHKTGLLLAKVLVTAHIQPGVVNKKFNFYSKQHKTLVDLFKRFADVIIAMHFGHEHADGFKLLTNDAGLNVPIFSAPSVTPIRFGPVHNPAIRLVRYDRATKKHLDISQYYMDLDTANRMKRAEWKLEYNFTDAYDVDDISAVSLKSVAERMRVRDSSEFNKYITYHYVTAPVDKREPCDEDCHAAVVCGITEFSMDEFDTCLANIKSGTVKLTLSLLLIVINLVFTVFCVM